MKVAVTTPTGHVGGAATDWLLRRGGEIKVRLLGRRHNTLAGLVKRGAEMAIGPQDNAEYLTKAMREVDAVFWVTPPGYGSDNVRAFQNRLGRAAATAIRASQVLRAINLSSIGAELDSGVGPVKGLHDVERILDDAAIHITHLRPGFFYENLLWQIDLIRSTGTISLPISGDRRFPMIAARDVGRVAAELLANQDWTGHNVRELHGPADLSLEEVAEILTQSLGRKVAYVRSDPQKTRQHIHHGGVSDNMVDLLLELYDAMETGKYRALQPRSAETTTTTTLADYAHEVMLPILTSSVTR